MTDGFSFSSDLNVQPGLGFHWSKAEPAGVKYLIEE